LIDKAYANLNPCLTASPMPHVTNNPQTGMVMVTWPIYKFWAHLIFKRGEARHIKLSVQISHIEHWPVNDGLPQKCACSR